MAARKNYTAAQIINGLRRAEVGLANGKSMKEVIRDLGVSEQTYYRWRREYGGMKTSQAKRLKELEKENQRLKRAVADLTAHPGSLEGTSPMRPGRWPSLVWRRSLRCARFPPGRSCSPSSRRVSDDGTKRSRRELQRRRAGPESGAGLSRPRDRSHPDRVARRRTEAYQVARASRLGPGQEAGGRQSLPAASSP